MNLKLYLFPKMGIYIYIYIYINARNNESNQISGTRDEHMHK